MALTTYASAVELFDYMTNELNLAQHQADHPWRLPVLITSNEGRVVVLRQVNTIDGYWTFYTDRRSSKVTQLKESVGVASATFYHVHQKIQVRMKGAISEVDKGQHTVHWNSLQPYQQLSYATIKAPGTELEKPGSGLSENWSNHTPSRIELKEAFKNFGVYTFKIDKTELLLLNRTGARRCLFKQWNPEDYSWLVP